MEPATEVEEVLGAEAIAVDVPVDNGDHAARAPRKATRHNAGAARRQGLEVAQAETRGRPELTSRIVDQIGERALRRRQTPPVAVRGAIGDLPARLQGSEDRRHIVTVSGPRLAPEAAVRLDPQQTR